MNIFISFCSPWSSSPQRYSLETLRPCLSSSCRSHWQKDSPITSTVFGKATTSDTVGELCRKSTSNSRSLSWLAQTAQTESCKSIDMTMVRGCWLGSSRESLRIVFKTQFYWDQFFLKVANLNRLKESCYAALDDPKSQMRAPSCKDSTI